MLTLKISFAVVCFNFRQNRTRPIRKTNTPH